MHMPLPRLPLALILLALLGCSLHAFSYKLSDRSSFEVMPEFSLFLGAIIPSSGDLEGVTHLTRPDGNGGYLTPIDVLQTTTAKSKRSFAYGTNLRLWLGGKGDFGGIYVAPNVGIFAYHARTSFYTTLDEEAIDANGTHFREYGYTLEETRPIYEVGGLFGYEVPKIPFLLMFYVGAGRVFGLPKEGYFEEENNPDYPTPDGITRWDGKVYTYVVNYGVYFGLRRVKNLVLSIDGSYIGVDYSAKDYYGVRHHVKSTMHRIGANIAARF